jgi:hypothetical protein
MNNIEDLKWEIIRLKRENEELKTEVAKWRDKHDSAKFKIEQEYQPWVSVKDRLPEKPQYDWVLVRITLNPDGFVGLPHIAELRRGEWFSTEYDLPIEQMLQGTVTHWKPLPEPPKGEGKC